MESEFRDYLRSLRKDDGGVRLEKRSIQDCVSRCRRVERHEGDLDQHFNKDQCCDLLQRLSNPHDHKIYIKGDLGNGSSSLKSAVKLYAEFRQRQILNDHTH